MFRCAGEDGGGDGGAVGGVGGTASHQCRLKPTPATKSALKRTGAGIPTRFNGFLVADAELIRRADWPVWVLRLDQPAAGGEDLWRAGGGGGAVGGVGIDFVDRCPQATSAAIGDLLSASPRM